MEVLNKMTDHLDNVKNRTLPTLPRSLGPPSESGRSMKKSSGGSPHHELKQMDIPLPKLVDPGQKDPDQLSLSRFRQRAKIRPGAGTAPVKSSRFEDDRPKEFNPEPLPYQPQYFKSTTVLKKVHIPRRHQDTFGAREAAHARQKDVILHSERYQWDEKGPPLQASFSHPRAQSSTWDDDRPLPVLTYVQTPHVPIPRNMYNYIKVKQPYKVTQRERHEAEKDYIDRMRGLKRKREVLPHRAPVDLLMGGKKADFTERVSVQDELNRLKTVVLPVNARDLYHGRGIPLPENHGSVKPRRPPYPDETLTTTSAPADLERQKIVEIPPILPTKVRRSKTTIGTKPQKKSDPALKKEVTVIGTMPEVELGAIPMKSSSMRQSASRPRIESASELESEDGYADQKSWNQSGPIEFPNVESDHEEEPEPLPEPEPELEQEKADSEMDIDEPPAEEPVLIPPTEASASPTKPVTPNPLKGMDFGPLITNSEREELTNTFKRLDTDADGHLMYNQLKTQLPKDLTSAQERYIKQVYDITSSSTFFGLDEFFTISLLCQHVAKLTGAAKEAYTKLNYGTLENAIMHYVELFQSVDRRQKGTITMDSLEEILSTALQKDRLENEDLFMEIRDAVNPEGAFSNIIKVQYLAFLPYFMSLADR